MTEQDADPAAIYAWPDALERLMWRFVQQGERGQALCRECAEASYYFGIAAVGCDRWSSV